MLKNVFFDLRQKLWKAKWLDVGGSRRKRRIIKIMITQHATVK